MGTSLTTFSETQEKAIILFIEGKTKVDIAKQCGVDRTTIYTWLNKPEFKQAIAKQRGDMFKQSKYQIKYLFNIGVKTAVAVLRDPNNKGFARVFEMVCKMVGVLDEKPQINIIVLNTVTPYGQTKELMKLVEDRIPLLTDEEKSNLIVDNGNDDDDDNDDNDDS